MYQDGNSIITATAAWTISDTSVVVGRVYRELDSNYWNGRIAELRVTKAARYAANFTPPTAALPTTFLQPSSQTLPVTITGSGGGGGGSGLTWSSVPASASATGTAGQIAYDGSYFYLATATNTWARASLGWTDADATAFIAAAGITDATQVSAVNTLVGGLKSAGVWSKLLLCYPFVGGSAAAHKWNLKDPRDLDAAYRLVFSGGWTHSSTGAAPDGSSAWADTKLNPATALSATSYAEMSYYRTNPTQPSTYVSQGARIDSTSPVQSFHTHFYSGDGNTYVDFGQRVVVANSTYGAATGAYSISRVSDSLITVYRNGSSVATGTATNNQLPSLNSYLGAMSYNTQGVTNYNSRQLSFYAISSGLTGAEMSAMYSTVQAFQTALSRNV